jgi:hypothetical protein
MKIIVQNGAKHLLTRNVIESLLPKMPTEWGEGVDSILICSSTSERPLIEYYPKMKQVAVWGTNTEKSLFLILRELFVSLSVLFERGDLPQKLNKSLYDYHLGVVSGFFDKI